MREVIGCTLGTSPKTVSSSALTAITWASFAMKTASASSTATRAIEGAPGRLAQTVPVSREAIGRPEQSPADGLTSTLRLISGSAPHVRDRPGRTVAVEQRCQRPLVSANLGCERGACLARLRTASDIAALRFPRVMFGGVVEYDGVGPGGRSCCGTVGQDLHPNAALRETDRNFRFDFDRGLNPDRRY